LLNRFIRDGIDKLSDNLLDVLGKFLDFKFTDKYEWVLSIRVAVMFGIQFLGFKLI